MLEFTAKEIIVMVLGSGGFIGGLISLFVFITGRLDKRKERTKEELKTQISQSADMKRFELDSSNAVHAQLWEIINAQQTHIANLEKDAEELEAKAILQRPTILRIYANIRAMRSEIDGMNVLIMSNDDTSVFMKRFSALKTLLNETEGMLP